MKLVCRCVCDVFDFIMDCLTSLDYMDELIRSRFINLCLLISLCGPLLNWLYLLSPMDAYGVTLILMYFVLALSICLFILNPAQLANKSSSNHCCQFMISLITMISFVTYQIALIIVNVSSTEIKWNTHSYLYSAQIFYCLSIAASIFVIFYYIITLMKLRKKKKSHNTFDLEKYIKLKSIYQQIRNNESTKDIIDANTNADRELNGNWCYLIYQFLWPTIDHKEYKSDSEITYYPSRLFFAVYLGLFAIVILFELQFAAHLWLHQQLDLIQSYMESIDETINDEWYILPQKAVDAMYWSIEYMRWIKTLLLAFTHGLLFGSITAIIISFYSSLIIFKAWNKKVINMRREIPTFRYNDRNKDKYCVWNSSNLIASLTMYFVVGYIYLTILLIICFGMLIYIYFWEITLPIYWPLVVVFIAYYIFIDNFIFKRFLMDNNGSIRKSENKFFEKCFKLLLIINDFMNFPMALFRTLFRILSMSVFMVISYLRPDISMYPRGLKHRDMAHSAFIASIRLLIEREKEYLVIYKEQYTKHCSGGVTVDGQNDIDRSRTNTGVVVVDDDDDDDNVENTMDFHAL